MHPHDTNIPEGLCQCGCGEPTKRARNSNPAKGIAKGQPNRFLPGHHLRLSPVEYVVAECGYETPCWVWQRAKLKSGYGIATRPNSKGKTMTAHRMVYERHHGPIPDGLEPDHKCRNRGCVNPDHLELVTHVENVRRSKTTKITLEIARAIRAAPGPYRDIGARYGISEESVSGIKNGRKWRE